MNEPFDMEAFELSDGLDLGLEGVEAALAMLDDEASGTETAHALSCETPAVIGTAATNSALSVESAAVVPEHAGAAPSGPKRTRLRDPSQDAKRRTRRKEERQELRRQVESYEQQLKTLAASAEDWKRIQTETRRWKSAAQEQRRRLATSEELNQLLKSELVERLELGHRIAQMLIQLTNCLSTAPERALVASRSREELIRGVRTALRGVYLATDETFACFMTMAGVADPNELFSTSHIRQSCELGPCVELLTSTPMPCNLQETAEVIWDWIASQPHSTISGYNYFGVSSQITTTSVEIQYDIRFSGEFSRETFCGATAMKKHEEDDREVLVFTTKMVHAAGGGKFCEKGWILVSRSPVDPLRQSIVRTRYRVACEQPCATMRESESVALRGFVQRKMAKRMRTRFKELQHELLRATGRHDLQVLIED